MVLLSGTLDGVPQALDAGRRSMRIVRQNLGWAVAYNAAALPLAIAGYVTPWLAGIGMAGSSLLVVLNALRLLKPSQRAAYNAQGAHSRDEALRNPAAPVTAPVSAADAGASGLH